MVYTYLRTDIGKRTHYLSYHSHYTINVSHLMEGYLEGTSFFLAFSHIFVNFIISSLYWFVMFDDCSSAILLNAIMSERISLKSPIAVLLLQGNAELFPSNAELFPINVEVFPGCAEPFPRSVEGLRGNVEVLPSNANMFDVIIEAFTPEIFIFFIWVLTMDENSNTLSRYFIYDVTDCSTTSCKRSNQTISFLNTSIKSAVAMV